MPRHHQRQMAAIGGAVGLSALLLTQRRAQHGSEMASSDELQIAKSVIFLPLSSLERAACHCGRSRSRRDYRDSNIRGTHPLVDRLPNSSVSPKPASLAMLSNLARRFALALLRCHYRLFMRVP